MRWDSLIVGLVLGLITPVLGFFIYGAIHVNIIRPHLDLPYFIHDLFLGTRVYQAPILSLSLLANLPLFFLLDRYVLYKAMRGVITATFIYGVVIVVLWM
ncbi:MAG: hypothetical protein KF905_05205 [Flavobacteriales bacterium]|nr:hypothetical protein [Flavobacteriales bacterium]